MEDVRWQHANMNPVKMHSLKQYYEMSWEQRLNYSKAMAVDALWLGLGALYFYGIL